MEQECLESAGKDRLPLRFCACPFPSWQAPALCASSTDTLLCQGFSKMNLDFFCITFLYFFTKCLFSWDFNSPLNSRYHFEKCFSFSPVSFYPSFPLTQAVAPKSLASVRKPSPVLNSAHCSVDLAFSLARLPRGSLLAASSTDVAAPAGAAHTLAGDAEDRASAEQDPLRPQG